jgi:hypothetical protein
LSENKQAIIREHDTHQLLPFWPHTSQQAEAAHAKATPETVETLEVGNSCYGVYG